MTVRPREPLPPGPGRLIFGAANLLTSALVALGVFGGLPSRFAPVDVVAGGLVALQLGAGLGLLTRCGWAARVARASAAVALAAGLFGVTVLAVTASWLAGIYGPVGKGGAIVLALVAALALPYLVVLPLSQLVWLRPREAEGRAHVQPTGLRSTLRRALSAWLLATFAACVLVQAHFALRAVEGAPVVATIWDAGKVVARAGDTLGAAGAPDAALDSALAAHPGAARVDEVVLAEGPVPAWPPLALSLSFVPGHDGLAASLDGHTAFVTADELLAWQAYDHGLSLPALQLSFGLDIELALALLGERLHVTPAALKDHGTLRRVRMQRSSLLVAAAASPQPHELSADDALGGAVAAARYLTRGVDVHGRFRYLVDAPGDRILPGYDWARHGGSATFLARVAALTGDGDLADAARRAARLLRDEAIDDCGVARCVAEGGVGDVSATALALLAFIELARTGLDPDAATLVPPLAAFLRGQQRQDGELMHRYDRAARAPVDVQLLYATGEAALALARTYVLLGDPRDLEASRRAVDHLVHRAWTFPGSQYYRSEEHWTCLAVDALSAAAPSVVARPDALADPLLRDALDFCLGWLAYSRTLMYGPGDTAFDADGAYGFGPVITPRLTAAGSRTEAVVATLDAARRAGRAPRDLAPLDSQARRSLALLLRHQLGRGRAARPELLARPSSVEGAFPGSEVDWALRIDYAQHAGSALLSWSCLARRIEAGVGAACAP